MLCFTLVSNGIDIRCKGDQPEDRFPQHKRTIENGEGVEVEWGWGGVFSFGSLIVGTVNSEGTIGKGCPRYKANVTDRRVNLSRRVSSGDKHVPSPLSVSGPSANVTSLLKTKPWERQEGASLGEKNDVVDHLIFQCLLS